MVWVIKDTETGEYRTSGATDLWQVFDAISRGEELWSKERSKAYRFNSRERAKAVRDAYIDSIKVVRLTKKGGA